MMDIASGSVSDNVVRFTAGYTRPARTHCVLYFRRILRGGLPCACRTGRLLSSRFSLGFSSSSRVTTGTIPEWPRLGPVSNRGGLGRLGRAKRRRGGSRPLLSPDEVASTTSEPAGKCRSSEGLKWKSRFTTSVAYEPGGKVKATFNLKSGRLSSSGVGFPNTNL